MSIPRPEHPRPQFMRKSWQNLNGEWQFCIDHGNSEPGNYRNPEVKLDSTIIVPFCPESKLSGIQNVDFMAAVWYKRIINVTAEQLQGRVIIHFGAVDYKTTLFVNKTNVGDHIGGYSSFSFDITKYLNEGENVICLRAIDDTRSGKQARGKQSPAYKSSGCNYTRTTGIWQTVWLEYVPKSYLYRVKVDTEYTTGTVVFASEVKGDSPAGATLTATVKDKGAVVAEVSMPATRNNIFSINVPDFKLWNPGAPYLYDVTYTLADKDGNVFDTVDSYFGIRTVETDGMKLKINGKTVFQRLVLDQGYYEDGLYTAPTEEDLIKDIQMALDLGFNGGRLHQKAFEERFLYHCDRMGYIAWGEYGNWGLNIADQTIGYNVTREWLEIVERDYNHPCIVLWCPYNEIYYGRGNLMVPYPDVILNTYFATKAVDRQRPVIDTSGFLHIHPTDIYDVHDYDHDLEEFKKRYAEADPENNKIVDSHPRWQTYLPELPWHVSEYGGIGYNCSESGWGYGETAPDMKSFLELYVGLTETLMQNKYICGMCYTQLYDIEQEQNGLYNYDRSPKFTQEIYDAIRACNSQIAAIEEE